MDFIYEPFPLEFTLVTPWKGLIHQMCATQEHVQFQGKL